MGDYAYAAPATVDSTVELLSSSAESGTRTQVLAGGTDVLVQMRSTDRGARLIVDIKQLAETNVLSIGEDEIYIGAAIPSASLNENAELKGKLPGLIESADLIGSTQIQGLCNRCWHQLHGSP